MLIAGALLALGPSAPTALGQTWGMAPLGKVPPVMSTATSASNVMQIIDVRANRNVFFLLSATNGVGTNCLYTLNFVRGDATGGTNYNWETNFFFTVSMNILSNTTTVVATNVDIGAAGYLLCTTCTITNALGTASNILAQYALKPGQ